MAENDGGETTQINLIDNETLPTGKNQMKGGFQIDISKEHGNWLTVGEIIHSIQKPISIYVDEIVRAFHIKLCDDLRVIGKCTSPEDCDKKTKHSDLCKSCQRWYKKLRVSHEKSYSPLGYKNCNSTKWSEDHWEVAKFFMSALGGKPSTVRDAKSTDVSSLLNVLEWMKDDAFLDKTQVNVGLVRKLRSQVRNIWAHAPQQEFTDDKRDKSFLIANDFLTDLEKVFPNAENGKCLVHLKHLKDNQVTNVVESELQSLLLQRHLLNDIKEEISKIKVQHSYEQSAINEHEEKLRKLECSLTECSNRMFDFERLKENINKQFNNFAEELMCFREIPGDISEIRISIGQIRDDLATMTNRQNEEQQPVSCLPDKPPMFTAREAEIQKVVSFLTGEGKAVVCLHGGPGFGKTAIAVEVSHLFSEDLNIPVVFSHLSTATTVDEMIQQLCLDVGVNHEDDTKQSLILWVRNIKEKVIFVMDDIDNLLEEHSRSRLYDFIRLLRKNSNCQIITTSRSSFLIPDLSTEIVDVAEMDDKACVDLLRKQCPEQDDKFLRRLAELCGKVPLAMCIAGSRVDEFEDSNELLQHLQKNPMQILERPESDQHVCRAIHMSYEMLGDEEKDAFVRLAVFNGSFSEKAARTVIEKGDLDTKRILKILVSRSLIKQPNKHRYSIHLLIKHFLHDQMKSEERAEVLMVEYYLNLGHVFTIQSYSKNGYKDSREALKKEAHNIQNVLKICCQQNRTSDVSNWLAHSKIYTTSARFFTLFVRTIIPGAIIDEFLQRCANLAADRKQPVIKINFDCLLADQELGNAIGNGKFDNYFKKMEIIEKEVQTHYEDLKHNPALCAYFYYQYGRYFSCKSKGSCHPKREHFLNKAREQLENSLNLTERLTDTSIGKADNVFSLLQLGNIWKKIASMEHTRKQTKECEEYSEKARRYYEDAIQLSQSELGEHELTAACYKTLGDQFLVRQKYNDKAEEMYTIAKRIREDLCLDASERHVYLLNNLGRFLMYTDRTTKAIEVLEKARDVAEKLAENNNLNGNKAKVYTTLAFAHHLVQKYSEIAVKYATKALEFEQLSGILPDTEFKKLLDISQHVTK